MMGLVKFRVEDGLKHLMADEEFKRRVINAYNQQVEINGGWGFTVCYKGYRIRFEDDGKTALATKGRVRVYVGYAEEKPSTVQKTLLEAFS
ncbi:MAG: hypothetical protein NZ932_07245 [Candidatus Bathyarchaeota archaeon]|nr:hypothetical protein [Candidatus Bathyarchaeota archaeon]